VKRLLIATTNPGKQREFRRLLAPLADVAEFVAPDEVGLGMDVEEPHDTYVENAATKAAAYAAASGLVSLADDSGLEVAALDWGPGVRTGRYGGPDVEDRVGYLLERMGDVADRRARMVCVVAVGIPGDGGASIEIFSGVMEGELATERRGSGGFGYDPVFLLAEGRTTAELPEEEKNRRSHRGQAVAAALPRLRELLGSAGQ
jgi:XTP/dITP diphosphohydrolase